MGKVLITYFDPEETYEFSEEQFKEMDCYLELRHDYDEPTEDYGGNASGALEYLKQYPGEELFLDRGGWQCMPMLKAKWEA